MGDSAPIGRGDLPPRFIRLLELLPRAFDVASGPVTIELVYQDGGFQVGYLLPKERVTHGRLAELQDSFDEQWDLLLGELLNTQ